MQVAWLLLVLTAHSWVLVIIADMIPVRIERDIAKMQWRCEIAKAQGKSGVIFEWVRVPRAGSSAHLVL
jgi:hypothetical protein